MAASRRDFLSSIPVIALASKARAQNSGRAKVSELITMSAIRLANLISTGEILSVEATQAYLDRIDEVNPKIGARVCAATRPPNELLERSTH